MTNGLIVIICVLASGYIFNYATNLPDTEGAPPIPSSFDQVIQRVAHTGLAHRNGIDQVTVNE